MTKVRLFFAALILAFSLIGISCRKFVEYPPEPQIEFNDFILLIDTLTGKTIEGILSIQYIDGDGDIGLEQSDTLPPFQRDGDYYYNFIKIQ